MESIRILILEDDLETLSILLKKLYELEEDLLAKGRNRDIAVTVFSEYTQVEDYLNKIIKPEFDVVLLDRDCKLGGSCTAQKETNVDVKKIISISSVPEYNEKARKFGVTGVIHKDYKSLEKFSNKVIALVAKLVT